MTENFDINKLRENLHTNLVLIVKQIRDYSSKFSNKISECLVKNTSKNELMNIISDLKKIDYQIQNNISDNIYFMVNNLNKMVNETTNCSTLNEKVKRYIDEFNVNDNNKGLKNLDILEDEVIYRLKKNAKYDDISYVKRIFESYRESINFAISSLNKKVVELLNNSLNDFNKNNDSMKEDKDLLLTLSFFNITYDKHNDSLLIDDNGVITKLEKIDENTYKIKDSINLIIKPNKNMKVVGITIDNNLKKAISINNSLNSITFLSKKKDGDYGVDYCFENGLIRIYEKGNIKNSDMINLDKLDKKIEDSLNSIDSNIISFIRKLEKNRIKIDKNELAFK